MNNNTTSIHNNSLYIGGEQILTSTQTSIAAKTLNTNVKALGGLVLSIQGGMIGHRPENQNHITIVRGAGWQKTT